MKLLFVSLFICLSVVVLAKQKNHKELCDTVYHGCNIEKGTCVCGDTQACDNPYVYKNEHQCHKDLKGEYDKCKKHPCMHGQCVQAKEGDTRRWVCSCAGSGFYGKRCQHECPPADMDNLPVDYPTDCIY